MRNFLAAIGLIAGLISPSTTFADPNVYIPQEIVIGEEGSLEWSPYNGRIIISGSYGGYLSKFVYEYNRLRELGNPVIISDACYSACTLGLGLLNNLVFTKQTVFGFHSAWTPTRKGPEHSAEGTRLMWSFLPECVQNEIIRVSGWDGGTGAEHSDLVFIKGTRIKEVCS